MPLIVRDQDKTQGHCWLPAAINATTPSASGVFINQRKVIVLGDEGVHPHSCTSPTPTTHPVVTIQGSPTVFAGGKPVIRDGDPMGCGDVADTQGGNVFADGGGNIAELFPGGVPAGQSPGETVSYVVAGPDALIASWPSFSLAGNVFDSSTTGHEVWGSWNNSALQPKAANLFKIRITEEDIGRSEGQRTFISTQGIGAPDLPAIAPPVFRAPLDSFVTFEVTQGQQAFNVDNAGTLTLKPDFVPAKDGTDFVREMEIKVRMIYGNQGIIFKDFPIEIDLNLR